jgi:predicted nucleic acid-binding protein
MDRLFLDANVLFSAAYKPDARVLRLWTLRNVALFTSRYALEEARFNLEDSKQKRSLEKLSRELQFLEAPEDQKLPRGVTLPDKDAPILLAAIEAKADYLLTGDIRHFGPYLGKNIAGVTVIPPGRYLKSGIRND